MINENSASVGLLPFAILLGLLVGLILLQPDIDTSVVIAFTAIAMFFIAGAARHLAPDGLLAVEVGAGAPAVEAAFPRLPFIWPEFEHGGDGIAVVAAGDLPRENDVGGRQARGG